MRKDKKNIIQITLTDREVEILNFIITEEGQGALPAVIHDCISNYYRLQYFNKQYMRKGKGLDEAPEGNLTNEQKCEKAGGRVIIREGILTCQIKVNEGTTRSIPLSRPDLF